MALEQWLPSISLTIVTLISVYMFGWLFIFLDQFVSPVMRRLTEFAISPTKGRFRFTGFFYHIPNFIFFLICVIFIFPWLIDKSYNTINPELEKLLKLNVFMFSAVIAVFIVVLYILFIHVYYKGKRSDLEKIASRIIRKPSSPPPIHPRY